MNNKGISLTEVLVTCCIVAIMGSVAVVNFTSHRDPVEKSQLFQSAKLWSAKVDTCLLNVGGWKIEGRTRPPCKIGGNSNFADKFKKRLGWECPVKNPQEDSTKAGPGCFPHFSGDDFYCLAIQKEVKGKKYQCVVHFDIEKRREKIYCGTPSSSSYDTVTCGESHNYTNLKLANQNKWPEGSSTPTEQKDPNISDGNGGDDTDTQQPPPKNQEAPKDGPRHTLTD